MNPKISVILPVYNCEEFLAEAIQSILEQSFTDFELIIINDSSTDNSESIIKNFSDERIVYIKNDTNQGLIYSLNLAIELSKSDMIARMDQDDIAGNTRLEKQYEYLKSNLDIGVLSSRVKIIDTTGRICGHWQQFSTSEEAFFRLHFQNVLVHPATAFRKELVLEAGGYPIFAKNFEDFALWNKLKDKTKIFEHPEELMSIRRLETGVTQKNKAQTLEKIDEFLQNSLGIQSSMSDLTRGYSQFENIDQNLKLLKEILEVAISDDDKIKKLKLDKNLIIKAYSKFRTRFILNSIHREENKLSLKTIGTFLKLFIK